MNITLCTTSILLASIVAASGCDKRDDTLPATSGVGTSGNRTVAPADDNTPMDQSESAAHIKITADIRREIIDDKSMSTNAQNCKVITDTTGRVTLRGDVDTQAEKDSIGAKASRIAGGTNVNNLLEVKAK